MFLISFENEKDRYLSIHISLLRNGHMFLILAKTCFYTIFDSLFLTRFCWWDPPSYDCSSQWSHGTDSFSKLFKAKTLHIQYLQIRTFESEWGSVLERRWLHQQKRKCIVDQGMIDIRWCQYKELSNLVTISQGSSIECECCSSSRIPTTTRIPY